MIEPVFLEHGMPAPDFTLADQTGKEHSLSGYRGQWVLVYFYPKDDTPGCTKEACAVRDVYTDLKKQAVQILGISRDSSSSHQKFADKYNLPFPILSDPDKGVLASYGAWGEKKFLGKTVIGTRRVSFLIDPSGLIAKVYKTVKPAEHAQQVLKDLQGLRQA